MSSQNEILLDLEELKKFQQLAVRPHVKDLLSHEVLRLEASLGQQCSSSGASGEPVEPMAVDPPSADTQSATNVAIKPDGAAAAAAPVLLAVSKTAPPRYYKDITTYAWDQSDKFMKIYVTLDGVQKLPKESFNCEYTRRSFQLKVDNLDGLNYSCHIAGLWGRIVPDQCYYKVKSDCVLVMLKKEEEKKTWAYVTEREDKKKKPMPHMDEKKDPNEGLMDLLKQLYEDGDDEMKRTIAKSWTESRNKNPGMNI